MDIWLQVYDIPNGLFSERTIQNIGKFVGKLVKTDPSNLNVSWKAYARVRITMDVTKPLKRKMKLKRDGGEWSWVNFKYERLSTFCFVCGLLGHSDRDLGIVYAHPDKEIPKAYGTWVEGSTSWTPPDVTSQATTRGERFMEIDGVIRDVSGDEGGISFVQRDKGNKLVTVDNAGEIRGERDMVVFDSKRKRIEREENTEEIHNTVTTGLHSSDGPKNGLEAGPVVQARLGK